MLFSDKGYFKVHNVHALVATNTVHHTSRCYVDKMLSDFSVIFMYAFIFNIKDGLLNCLVLFGNVSIFLYVNH